MLYIVQPRGNVIDFDIFQRKRERNHLLVDRVMFLWNWLWISRCGQSLQLKLLTDQDTWDACVGAGIFSFDSSPSLVWPFSAPICRLFIGFFLPLLAFPGHHGQPRPLLSDCGIRPSQWFHQPTLHHSLLFHRRWRQRQGAKNDDICSGDAARDVGYKRHFSKEQLEDWKTPLEIEKDNMWGACTFSAQYVLQKF